MIRRFRRGTQIQRGGNALVLICAHLRNLRTVLFVLALAGCRPHASEPAARDRETLSTQPTTAFAGQGVRFNYPADWTPAPSDEYVLRLVPRDAADDADATSVSLDVPKLPPHIPGFIPLGLVVNGYVDDLKEKYPGIRVEDPVDTTVAGSKARRVHLTWDEGGRSRSETAFLTVHDDRVYIFRANADAASTARAVAALGVLLDSVRWE